jgi:nuclear mRNA export protein SAC3
LDLDELDDRVIGKEILLIETFADVDFVPAMTRLSDLVMETVNPNVARALQPKKLVKRKRLNAPMFANLVDDSPQTKPVKKETSEEITPPKRQKVQLKNGQKSSPNWGMETRYFQYKARGLHLDWQKFPLPTGGELGDGIENPVGNRIMVTTAQPHERSIKAPEQTPPVAQVTDDLMDVQRMLSEINSKLDEGLADMRSMNQELMMGV